MTNLAARAADRLVTRAQAGIVETLRAAGAFAPAKAVALSPARRSERKVLERMVKYGAVVAEREGHYWLDERALPHFRKEELARILGAIAVAGLAAAGAIALGR